ncbi:MAG TPA: hypothetical protein PK069_09080 [Methanolinea sp.]|nr:hypothetical protein [Methanolinea sp.]
MGFPPTASRLDRHDSLPLVPRLSFPAHFLLIGPLTLVSTATSLRSVTGCFLAAAQCTPCPEGGYRNHCLSLGRGGARTRGCGERGILAYPPARREGGGGGDMKTNLTHYLKIRR